MRKPVARPPKPPRIGLVRNTLAENAAVMRGIAADPDNPEWTREEMAQARTFSLAARIAIMRVAIEGRRQARAAQTKARRD